MNVSAMTRLVSTFPEALGALVIFREEYCRRFQIAQLSLLICGGLNAGVFQRFSGRVWRAVCLWLQRPAVRARYRIAPMKPP